MKAMPPSTFIPLSTLPPILSAALPSSAWDSWSLRGASGGEPWTAVRKADDDDDCAGERDEAGTDAKARRRLYDVKTGWGIAVDVVSCSNGSDDTMLVDSDVYV